MILGIDPKVDYAFKYLLRFRFLEDPHHFALTQDIEFHVLELHKFAKSLGESPTWST